MREHRDRVGDGIGIKFRLVADLNLCAVLDHSTLCNIRFDLYGQSHTALSIGGSRHCPCDCMSIFVIRSALIGTHEFDLAVQFVRYLDISIFALVILEFDIV